MVVNIKFFLLLCLTIIALVACKRDYEKPTWQVDALVPLIKSELSVKNIVPDSNYRLAEDSSVTLVFNQVLDSFNLKALNEFTIDPFFKKIKLNSLILVTDTIVQRITLGQIARQLTQDPNLQIRLIGVLILANHGQSLDNIPDFNNITAPAIPFSVNEWFRYALLKKGILNISISNKLPITVSNIEFSLSNQTLEPKQILATAFQNILPNQSRNAEVILENKKIEGDMSVAISDMDLKGGNNVAIDTNAALEVKVAISDIELQEAEAVFPAQNVIVDTVSVPITMVEGVEAKETVLESGIVRIKVLSTLRDSLFYTYKIPNATTPDGKRFEIFGKIPPSKTGTALQYEYIANFDGFKIDLRGALGQDTVNTFFSDFTAAIRYTGKPVFLSLINDSLEVSITLEKLKPSYLRGFISQDTVIKGKSQIDFFKNIQATLVDFNKITMALEIKNSFGIKASIIPEFLSAISEQNREEVLNDPLFINVPQSLDAATDNPLIPKYLQLSSSNVAPLFNILPRRVSYQFRVKTGQSQSKPKIYDNFAYLSSVVAPTIKIQAPLNFSAQNLVLTDTLSLTNDFFDQVKNGKFKLIATNGFPIDIALQLDFVDKNLSRTLLLVADRTIMAANINNTTQKVSKQLKTELVFNLPSELILAINQSSQVIVKATFNTMPNNQQLKLYDSYKLDLKIVGDIKYQVND